MHRRMKKFCNGMDPNPVVGVALGVSGGLVAAFASPESRPSPLLALCCCLVVLARSDAQSALSVPPAWNDFPSDTSIFQAILSGHAGTRRWRSKMIDEGEPLHTTDAPSILGDAAEAVQTTTEAVAATTKRIAARIEAARRPGAPLDRLANWTREAPLHALLVAFLVGVVAGRRR
jgi:hypothetical protein